MDSERTVEQREAAILMRNLLEGLHEFTDIERMRREEFFAVPVSDEAGRFLQAGPDRSIRLDLMLDLMVGVFSALLIHAKSDPLWAEEMQKAVLILTTMFGNEVIGVQPLQR